MGHRSLHAYWSAGAFVPTRLLTLAVFLLYRVFLGASRNEAPLKKDISYFASSFRFLI